jgi:[ribosomal protein S5]-alanine N-acetyltransferase
MLLKDKNKELLGVKIITENLLLIPISMEFKNQIFEEFTEYITVFMHPKPPSEKGDTEKFINDSLRGLKENTNLQLMILSKDGKEFFGCAGLHHVDRATPEFGIWIKKSAQGNKYGLEAIAALKGWADDNLDYNYILYPVAEQNIASLRIAENLEGKLARRYAEKNQSGKILDILEYHIYG